MKLIATKYIKYMLIAGVAILFTGLAKAQTVVSFNKSEIQSYIPSAATSVAFEYDGVADANGAVSNEVEVVNYKYYNLTQALQSKGYASSRYIITRVEITATKLGLDSLTFFLCRGQGEACFTAKDSSSGVLKSADLNVNSGATGMVVFLNSDPAAVVIGLGQEGEGSLSQINVTVAPRSTTLP